MSNDEFARRLCAGEWEAFDYGQVMAVVGGEDIDGDGFDLVAVLFTNDEERRTYRIYRRVEGDNWVEEFVTVGREPRARAVRRCAARVAALKGKAAALKGIGTPLPRELESVDWGAPKRVALARR